MATERSDLKLSLVNDLERPSDSDLRILIFTATYFVLDGVTLTIRRLESHLRSRGATVKILSTVPENIEPHLIRDVIVVPGIKIPFNHAGDYSFGVGLDESTIRQIEEFKPNVVHFTVPDFVGLDGIRWCQRNNIAYIGTWHSNYVEYLKYYFLEWILGPGLNRYLRGFFEQMPTVYVPTPYMLRKMKDDWGYGVATELKEWGRGVDMSIFSPERRSETFRTSRGITENDIIVLWVSRIVPEKRPDIWLAVVKRLQEEGLPIKPLVVGSGTFEKYLSQLKDVHCCGWLSGAALGEAYASSDVLLFPSDVETFGNVTLEALASGCPSIVEQKCGEHLVEHGVNGLTCVAGDFEGFYQATRRLVMDARLRQQMSIAAREKAWKYERNIILQQMAENYKDAIVKHRDPQFVKAHISHPEGGGRNFLAILCCNYYFIKIFAEPFLNTSRNVQDMVENTAECVSLTRNRLSCGDFLTASSTNNLNSITDTDIESGLMVIGPDGKMKYVTEAERERFDDNKERKYHATRQQRSNWWCANVTCCSPGTWMTSARVFHWLTILFSMGIILLFIYASFTI